MQLHDFIEMFYQDNHLRQCFKCFFLIRSGRFISQWKSIMLLSKNVFTLSVILMELLQLLNKLCVQIQDCSRCNDTSQIRSVFYLWLFLINFTASMLVVCKVKMVFFKAEHGQIQNAFKEMFKVDWHISNAVLKKFWTMKRRWLKDCFIYCIK